MERGRCRTNLRELRMSAKEALRGNLPDIPERLDQLSPREAGRLVHELRVYQVELEMQNEDLRSAQLELQESRAQYFELYDLAPIGYVTLDRRGMIEKANLTAAQLLGLQRRQLIQRPLTRFIAREDQDRYYLHRKALLEGRGEKACELKMTREDDSQFWARLEMAGAPDEGADAPPFRVVITDITERKEAEEMLNKAQLELEKQVRDRTRELAKANEALQVQINERNRVALALKKSNEHYQEMIGALPMSIIGHTGEGIVFANDASARLMEIATPEDLIGRDLVEFITSEDREIFTQQFREALHERQGQEALTTKLVSMTGTTVDVELSFTALTYQEQPAVQVTAYNLTRRKRIEDELIKMDRLESISILAGGIAHDFNNYLATVLGNITLAMMNDDDPIVVNRHLENIELATHRVKLLTNQLFTFAKGGAPLKRTVSLHDLISDSIQFAVAGSNVQCRSSLPEDLYLAEVDEGQITQVVCNIIINATQAMPTGGTIEVQGENVTLQGEDENGHIPLPDGNYSRVSITDEGPGIPENLLRRIFDPFFSTKEQGKGLGLATSYSIIRSHGGYIHAESPRGQGATFSIYLPASTETSLPDTEDHEIIHGTGRILIVDDEASLRDVMAGMLCSLGYQVHKAKDGEEAVAAYTDAEEAGRPFDLVVMDLTIPGGMGGREAVQVLRKIDPTVKVIVSSGYSDEPVMANYTEYGFEGVIRKPYTIYEVSRVVHQVMNAGR